MQDRPLRPVAHGLYRPETEHDACGIAFVANIQGRKSRAIVEQALGILDRLAHRGACGCDPDTGDGSGILVQLPHRFFKRIGLELGFDMPRRRAYGVGQVFLPPDPRQRQQCEEVLESVVTEEGQRVLGWRDVPIDPAHVGHVARRAMPMFRQIFIGRRRVVPTEFERKLYVIRKLAERRIRERGIDPQGFFHVPSLSAETVVYKGLLKTDQLTKFYDDLREPDFVSAIAMVHSRFSTNTFPTWDLAQPFRRICHNGEINTVRGNSNWMQARRSMLQSAKFGGDLARLGPIINQKGSDSSKFDNIFELLHLGGRALPHAMMMMIPEAWENDDMMDPARRAFYEYSSALVEPWDGPAAIAFSDGHIVGATLDRNGLRPARYVTTTDDRVILASEAGVIDIPPEQIVMKGRLKPGRMFVVDTREQRIIGDEEVKADIAGRYPYRRWLEKNQFSIDQLPLAHAVPESEPIRGELLETLQRAFGYTDEDIRILLEPMAASGEEPTGSMGTDTPLAVLSDGAPVLYDYFKQLFAQVTNPPIDPIREALVMSLVTAIGGGSNTFDETPEQCHRLVIPGPLMTDAELAVVKGIREGIFETETLSTLYDREAGPSGLAKAVRDLCQAAAEATDQGYNILVLSDRGAGPTKVAIPALLAVAAVHHHLIREGIRLRTGLIVETADVREVHHIALLVGYGAAGINPYLALATVRDLAEREIVKVSPDYAEKNFVKAIHKGLLKVMSKMGISALISYRGAQIFEAVGLAEEVVNSHFTGTPSRIGGIGLEELGREVIMRHDRGFGPTPSLGITEFPAGGVYQWRRRGERHMWNPATIAKLQAAIRTEDREAFSEYTKLANEEASQASTIRSLLEFVEQADPVPLDEVEPATEIVKRFCTGAMSFGSISAEAHETLAIAMNRIGGKSNSGEGGEEEVRFATLPNGDRRSSAIKQVASGRFGVHIHYLTQAKELQIKIAQGAKPGEGGQLPGHKISERIGAVRCSTPGVTLISPPPHHDIYSIEDLAQLIYDLKVANSAARISVKLVSEMGVGTVAAGVSKARAGGVTIAGDTGGTGASPLSSLRHAGLPWELGLAESQQVLVQNDLRGRIRVQVDGGLRTSRDVVVGALLGAEEFGFATAPLVTLGCILLRKCHLNTCSVGIATQDPELIARFSGEPKHVIRFFMLIAEGVRELMSRLGFRTFDEMIGRSDKLRPRADIEHWKARKLHLDAITKLPNAPDWVARRCVTEQDYGLERHLDQRLIPECRRAIEHGERARLSMDIRNVDRTVGAMLSGEIAKVHGSKGLPQDTIVVQFRGSAGQSFGAFLSAGVTFALEGDANDYVGKGLSGGRIAVYPSAGSTFVAEENIIIGNVVLYGATGGEVYAAGIAGERFAVRNSGARAVVEGVGDHGCEYMTGGIVVVLGRTGRNFGAGMSGGFAFVFDDDGKFRKRCNHEMITLEGVVEEADIDLLRGLIEAHVEHTGSQLGTRILENWDLYVTRFVKVMPTEYRKALLKKAEREAMKARPSVANQSHLSVVEGT